MRTSSARTTECDRLASRPGLRPEAVHSDSVIASIGKPAFRVIVLLTVFPRGRRVNSVQVLQEPLPLGVDLQLGRHLLQSTQYVLAILGHRHLCHDDVGELGEQLPDLQDG